MRTTELSQNFIKQISHWILLSSEGEGVTSTSKKKKKIYRGCIRVKKIKRRILDNLLTPRNWAHIFFFLLNVPAWLCDGSPKKLLSVSAPVVGTRQVSTNDQRSPRSERGSHCFYNFKLKPSLLRGHKIPKTNCRGAIEGLGIKGEWCFAKSPKTSRAELFHGNEEVSVEVDGACVHACVRMGWGPRGGGDARIWDFKIWNVIWKSLVYSKPKPQTLPLLLRMVCKPGQSAVKNWFDNSNF